MSYRVTELDVRQRAMLDFAWKLIKTPDAISDDDRRRLLQAVFDERDIFDICDVAAFFNYTNRMTHGLDMVPNPEYCAMDQ